MGERGTRLAKRVLHSVAGRCRGRFRDSDLSLDLGILTAAQVTESSQRCFSGIGVAA